MLCCELPLCPFQMGHHVMRFRGGLGAGRAGWDSDLLAASPGVLSTGPVVVVGAASTPGNYSQVSLFPHPPLRGSPKPCAVFQFLWAHKCKPRWPVWFQRAAGRPRWDQGMPCHLPGLVSGKADRRQVSQEMPLCWGGSSPVFPCPSPLISRLLGRLGLGSLTSQLSPRHSVSPTPCV